MNYRDLRFRLDRLELNSRPRNKPWVLELEHDEPAPFDTDGVFVVRLAPGWRRQGPAEGPSTWSYIPDSASEK